MTVIPNFHSLTRMNKFQYFKSLIDLFFSTNKKERILMKNMQLCISLIIDPNA